MSKRFTWTVRITPLRALAFCAFLGAIWYGFTFVGEQHLGERNPTEGEAALLRTPPTEPPQSRTIDHSGSALLALPGVRKVEVIERNGYETLLLMVDPHWTNPLRIVAAGCDVLREHGSTANVLVRVIDAGKFAANRTEQSLASKVCNHPQGR